MPTADETPILFDTERLLFRELTDEDHAALYDIYSDPRVNRFLGGPPAPFEEYLERVRASWPEYYRKHGFGLWAALRKEDGRLVGRAGLLSQEVDGVREVEVAYALGAEFWGHGYATEAARAVRDRAFRTLDVPHVISLILPENEPSTRVAGRNGMTLWKTVSWRDHPEVRVYRITREEWERGRSTE